MKKIILTIIIGMVISSMCYPQFDLVVLNSDTVKCKIIENSLDWVSYFSNGMEYKVSENQLTIFNGITSNTLSTPLSINHIKFFENPQTTFTTQDLLKKIDFTSKSTHFTYVINSNGMSEPYGFDTTNNKIYWFGLDFSQVVIQLGTATRNQYSQPFFSDCNDFIISNEKFRNFRELFNFKIDTGIVINRNNNLNVGTIYNSKSKILSLENIRRIISTFPCNYEGVGFIIFYTEINKELENITFYLTFFDIKSKTVLLCLKAKSQTSGIGMGWHWTKPFKDYFDNLVKNSEWRTRFQITQKKQ